MPHASVKTIRDLIYWEYAKLVADSAVGDRKNRAFGMHIFKQFRSGQKHPSDILRENRLLVEKFADLCAYCATKEHLTWEHIIPSSRGGPDSIDNQVLACARCNGSKNDRDPYEWYCELYGEKEGKYKLPRLVWGKYLKIMYELHELKNTLDQTCTKTLDITCVLLPRARANEKDILP